MTIYLSHLSTPFAEALAGQFTALGHAVLTGNDAECVDAIDVAVLTEDKHLPERDTFSVTETVDAEAIMALVRENDAEPISLLDALLPKLDKGALKRVCVLASAPRVSQSFTTYTRGYGYALSKTAFLQSLRFAYNLLRGEGYTFRVYDPMQSDDERVPLSQAAKCGANYFLTSRGCDPYRPKDRSDENRYVIRDALGREWPW